MKKKNKIKDDLVPAIIVGIIGFIGICGNIEETLLKEGEFVEDVFLASIYSGLVVFGASFLCLMIVPTFICIINYSFYKKHTKAIYIINGIALFIMAFVTERKCPAFGFGGLGILIYSFLLYCIIERIMRHKNSKINKEITHIVEDVKVHDDNFENKYNDLIKLKELLDKKIITNAEFEKEKDKILNK